MSGAPEHRFRLGPLLNERELAAVEEQFGARLPGEYRGFLTEVGARGAGPGLGLFGFRRANGLWLFAGDRHRGHDQVDLRTEFPHWTAFHHPEWPDLTRVPEPGRHDLARELDARDEAATRGTVPLCHHGYDLLVVTGPDRGAGWADDEASDGGIGPVGGTRVTFGRWYLGWLESVEARLSR